MAKATDMKRMAAGDSEIFSGFPGGTVYTSWPYLVIFEPQMYASRYKGERCIFYVYNEKYKEFLIKKDLFWGIDHKDKGNITLGSYAKNLNME